MMDFKMDGFLTLVAYTIWIAKKLALIYASYNSGIVLMRNN